VPGKLGFGPFRRGPAGARDGDFQRDYKLVEEGYKNHLDMKANSEASLPPSDGCHQLRTASTHTYSHRPFLSAELIRTVADKPATAAGGTTVCIIAG